MSSKRASLATVSSLLKLCNGCYSRHVADCSKGLNELRAISTAPERSDFQFSGSYQTDDSFGCQQNHVGFYHESQNMVDSNELLNRQRSDHVGQANASGFYGNNNHASSDYRDGQIAAGGHMNLPKSVVQNNLIGHNRSVGGYPGQSSTNMQHVVGGAVDNSWSSGMHPNASPEKQNLTLDPGHRMQYPNVYSSPRPLESRGNLKGNFPKNISHFQQSPNGHYSGSYIRQQYSGSDSGQFHRSINAGPYPPNLNNVQGSMVGSHLSSNAKGDCGSGVASNGSPYRGTLEELDSFCTEGKMKEAVEVLELLDKQHIPVDLSRYMQLMHHCGEAKCLKEAKIIHRHALQHSLLEVSTYHKILEMYLKCGSVDDAFNVFNDMPDRDLTTWDFMIKQLAKNGFAEDSIDLFTQFKKLGLKPDGQMFIGVFSACSMLGDIDEGLLHFESMSKDYGIVPSMAHYVSVVDMIGSIGHLNEALEFIEKMPMDPSADVWETLMNVCRLHGNTELGDRCAELVEQLDPSRLNEQSKAGLVPVKTTETRDNEMKKSTSKHLLQVKSRVHEYRAGDTSHPENDKIYALLRGMKAQMKEEGYIPETKFVLHDIDQEGKEEALLAHSERLAVAYALLTSSARSPIRVIKNLRVCGDCHNALKIISKLVGRELIIRDAKRFHHFKDGLCSCRDYW